MNNYIQYCFKKFHFLVIFFIALCSIFVSKAFASTGIFCSAKDGMQTFVYDVTYYADENLIGYESEWRPLETNRSYTVSDNCAGQNIWFRYIPGPFLTYASGPTAIDSFEPVWHDIQGNEYLQVAVQIFMAGGRQRRYNVPANIDNLCGTALYCFPILGTGAQAYFKYRIKNRFVGHSSITSTELARVRGSLERLETTADNNDNIAQVILTATVIVQQSCTFDVGDIVIFDFDQIPSTAFIGNAGDPARGVQAQRKKITMSCKGIDAQQMLSARIEGNNIVGNALVATNNPNVGFSLAAGDSSTALIPNNINSNIPFQLDDNFRGEIDIKAWPVAVTGNKAEPGLAVAEGYLRIDFQ